MRIFKKNQYFLALANFLDEYFEFSILVFCFKPSRFTTLSGYIKKRQKYHYSLKKKKNGTTSKYSTRRTIVFR